MNKLEYYADKKYGKYFLCELKIKDAVVRHLDELQIYTHKATPHVNSSGATVMRLEIKEPTNFKDERAKQAVEIFLEALHALHA